MISKEKSISMILIKKWHANVLAVDLENNKKKKNFSSEKNKTPEFIHSIYLEKRGTFPVKSNFM